MKTGNDICPQCLSAHPVTMDCSVPPIMTDNPEPVAQATAEVERLTRELDITNADHIVLWLEENKDALHPWMAVQIVEAFERAVSRKHVSWGAGEPDCPPDIKASNGELHTLRCKVCGKDIARSGEICYGR